MAVADAARRELERQAATGDADARARLLGERLRDGTLTRERVWLAAHLGESVAEAVAGALPVPAGKPGFFERARRALVGPPFDPEEQARRLLGTLALRNENIQIYLAFARDRPGFAEDVLWLLAIAGLGKEVLVRVAVAGLDRPAKAPAAAWAVCPCRAHQTLAGARAATFYALHFEGAVAMTGAEERVFRCNQIAAADGGLETLAEGILLSSSALPVPGTQFVRPDRERLRERLLPWALGDEDPLAAELQARLERRLDATQSQDSLERGRAVAALADLGTLAAPAIEALEALAANDPDTSLRAAAERALVSARGDTVLPTEAELSEIRDNAWMQR